MSTEEHMDKFLDLCIEIERMAKENGGDARGAANLVAAELDLPLARHFAANGVYDTYLAWKGRQRRLAQAIETGEPVNPSHARMMMNEDQFPLPTPEGTVWIEHARATIEQHSQRIFNLRKLMAGIQTSVDRHEDAIAQIKSAGVSCLADIPAQAPVPRPSATTAPASGRGRHRKAAAPA